MSLSLHVRHLPASQSFDYVLLQKKKFWLCFQLVLVRDVKGGIGSRAGSVKACSGAGLGRSFVGPFFRDLWAGCCAGWAESGMDQRWPAGFAESRNPNSQFSFCASTWKNEREKVRQEGDAVWRISGDRVSRSMMLPVYHSPSISSGEASWSHHKKFAK